MLVGTPITHLIKMGPKALTAMISSIVTMLAATFLAYVLVMKWLPDEGWKAAGALLGTWIGGSANMLAVKSILNLSDAGYAPLIIVDTVMSYGWMALLIGAAPHQEKINRWLGAMTTESSPVQGEGRVGENTGTPRVFKKLAAVAVMLLISTAIVWSARKVAAVAPLLSTTAWALLFSSTLATVLSMTPLQKFESWGASKSGQFLLYLVLVSIGAKTTLGAAMDAPVYFAFGFLILFFHGVMMFAAGRFFKLPLILLSTASQAAVGGPVSAPIVAEAYNPSLAHIGVLMAILGAVAGTYAGVAGGFICKLLSGQ
jgi:uncharacterized membrane protein